jgi:hypothetical protein
MINFSMLRITDGTHAGTVSLINGIDGYALSSVTWGVAGYKGGGSWQESPFSDGRQMVDKAFDNVVHSFTLMNKGATQMEAENNHSRLESLLEKATDYWVAEWANEPVWLERLTKDVDAERQYAMIRGFKLEEMGEFVDQYDDRDLLCAGQRQQTMVLECTQWQAWPSIADPCVEDTTETITWVEEGCDPSYLVFDGADSLVNCGNDVSLRDIPDNAVAGRGNITVEAYIRADGYGEGNQGHICAKGFGFQFNVTSSGGLEAYVNCAGQFARSQSGLDEFTADSEFHHVLMTYSEVGSGGATARWIFLAIDGAWVTSYPVGTRQASAGNYVSDAAVSLSVGNNAAATRTFDGAIGWVRVSDRIVHDPAGGDFTPPERCEPPLPCTGTQLLLHHAPGYGATTTDYSGYGNDGALTLTEWGCDCLYETTEYPCWPSYLQCNGETGSVVVPAAASIDDIPDNAIAGRGEITVQAWIRARGYGEDLYGRIAVKGSAALTTRGWHFLAHSTLGLAAYVDCATTDAISTTNLTEFSADGEWHHVLMTYDETGGTLPAARTIYLAVDGVWSVVAPVSVSAGNYSVDNGDDLIIGNNSSGTATFDGDIGWVKIDSGIIYDPAGGDFTPEPRCRWPAIDLTTELQVIYEGAGAVTYDRSGNDNTGTITTAVWGCDCDYTDELDIECNCVEASGRQFDWMYEPWALNSALPVGSVDVIVELAQTPGRLLAGDNGEIWHTDNGGATAWIASTVPPAAIVTVIVEHPTNGHIIASGPGPGVYLSVDGGINWTQVNAARACQIHGMVYRQADNTFYMVDDNTDTVYSSVDEGTTWIPLFTADDLETIGVLNGVLYVGAITGHVYRSSDGGASWDTFGRTLNGIQTMNTPGDGRLYISSLASATHVTLEELDINTGDIGVLWTDLGVGVLPYAPTIIYTGSRYWLCTTDGFIYKANEPTDWKFQVDTGGITQGLAYYSYNGLVYAGLSGDIYRQGGVVDLGRGDTCRNEVYVANKSNISNVSEIFVYDASLTTYTDQFPAAAFPYTLFPAAAQNNDLLYIGFEYTIVDSGPACSAVFDLMEVATDVNWTIIWEYYGTSGGPGWVTLNVTDNTDQFRQPGVNSVHWVPPDDWVVFNVNGSTLYWIRARLSTAAGAYDPPIQQHRDVYSVTWPHANVDDADVAGNIPAHLRIKAENQSDDDVYTTVDELDLLDNRVIVGLRSYDRGPDFTCFVNLADDTIVANTHSQNPIGIVVDDGTGTTTAAEIHAPSGIAAVHTTQGNGITSYDDALTVTFGPSIARDYYGRFHAYLRAQLYEPSASPAGTHDSVRVRLQMQTGSGGIVEWTPYAKFTGRDAWDGVAGREETYNDYQLLDMGVVALPVSSLFQQVELPDTFVITVQVASAAATNLRVEFYDLCLVPVDEWAGDFSDTAFEDDSGVGNGQMLDIDSVSFAKQPIRALVKSADATEYISAAYKAKTAPPAFLQHDADQRLWFLTARGVAKGEQTGGGSGTILQDSYQDFVDAGVKPGMVAYNVTDGTSAVIASVDSATQITTATLGSVWTAADEYLIICPNWRSEPWVVHSVQLFGTERWKAVRGDS